MNPIDDQEARDERARADRQERKRRAKEERADVQAALESPAVRRVLWRFLDASGHGLSVYRDRPHAMAHAAGWQDAAAWWLNEIRTHCPEREAQMRSEARKRDNQPQDTSDEQ